MLKLNCVKIWRPFVQVKEMLLNDTFHQVTNLVTYPQKKNLSLGSNQKSDVCKIFIKVKLSLNYQITQLPSFNNL